MFVCSTPINSHQILHFDRTLPFSPISKTRVGTPRPPVYSSPYKKTHAAPLLVDLDQQEHHVTSSQPTPTEKQSNTLPRPEITSPRSISKFDRFQQIRSKEIISTNLEQEIRIQNVYQTPKATRKSSFVSPVNISPIRTTRRSPVEDPEDMELPVLPINASNRDILMEVDQQTNHKPTAQKTVRRNTTNYESNIEETPMRAANHASLRSAAKAVQARLAIVEISEDEEEAVGDQNISEDQSNEIEGNKNNNNPG